MNFFGGFFGEPTGLLVALILGVAFGFVLERGGFGSARKLAAQFYLTDLTVFKTMFTAIITAMVGLFILSAGGFVDLGMMSNTPTYLIPQAVGGLVFGIGFVMGGYCPGTACVATSTGKIDSIVHIFGMVAGITTFGELFPLFKSFYYSTPMGQISLPQLLGIPTGYVVVLIVVMAMAGFVLGEWIEKRNRSGEVVSPIHPAKQGM